jgi:hypothetical protein
MHENHERHCWLNLIVTIADPFGNSAPIVTPWLVTSCILASYTGKPLVHLSMHLAQMLPTAVPGVVGVPD